MGPIGSLPHSQAPATCPYPGPARSIPYPQILLLKDASNIIIPSTPGSPKWYLSLRCSHQNPVYASLLSHTHYMPRPSHSSWFHHPNNIGWGVQIVNPHYLVSPLPCHLVPSRPKYSPQHPILRHTQPTFLPHCERPSFTPIQNKRQNYSSLYLNV